MIGIDIQIQKSTSARETADTGTLFAALITEKGPATPVLCRSKREFETTFGGIISGSDAAEYVRAMFEDGISRIYVQREFGPTPVKATANIYDQSGSTSPGDVALTITAREFGEWGNGLNVEVDVSGTDFEVIVSHDDDGELERSGLVATRADAVTWGATATYVTIALGASNEDPRAQGPTSFASGTADISNITNDEHAEAIALFATGDLGPGQVAVPGVTTSAVHTALLQHGAANNRRALIDLPNDDDPAAQITAIETITEDEDLADVLEYGAAWGNWLSVPGSVAGTEISLPPSCQVAALIARSDRANTPSRAAAGENGISGIATDLLVEFSEDDRNSLADAQINVFASIGDTIRNYGWRTLAPKADTPEAWSFGQSRLLMALVAELAPVAEHFMFEEFDGKRRKLSQFERDITGVLLPYYTAGSLYGDSPQEAFRVDARSVAVNSDADLQDGNVTAEVGVRISPFGEHVQINLTNQAITTALPA